MCVRGPYSGDPLFINVLSFLGHMKLSDKVLSKTQQYWFFPTRAYFCVKLVAKVALICGQGAGDAENYSHNNDQRLSRKRTQNI